MIWCFVLENTTDMAMCEEPGLATRIRNQYDDIKDSHKCDNVVDFMVLVVVVIKQLRGRTRFRSTHISRIDIYEIAFSPRSRHYCSSDCESAMCEKCV